MELTLENLIQQCEEDIRAGRHYVVKARLAQVNTSKVPRALRIGLARLCRRAGLHSLGLKLLSTIIQQQLHSKAVASPAEIAEYAILLLRSGAIDEAIHKLEAVDMKDVPEAPLYRAYGHFIRWEYDDAVPLLEEYILAPITPYALAIGKANLAYALTELRRHPRAIEVLEDNIPWLEKNGHRQLLSNCQTLRAQIYLQDREFTRARAQLEIARKNLDLSQSNDHFLVEKLDLILRGLETGSIKPLEELSVRAAKKHDWESMREADLFLLKVRFDESRFNHLIFGSRFPGFRERIQAELGRPLPQEGEYVFGPPKSPCFDLMSGEIDGKLIIKPGTKCHQLLEVLLRDFYQAPRIAALFSQLFPGETFDIDSSPDRVHQILRRTRRWIKETSLPFKIAESGGFYSLRITGKISFRLPLKRQSVEHMNLHFHALRELFPNGRHFTAHEARNNLAISKTTVFRLINWGMEEGKIERTGETQRKVMYKIPTAA